MAQSKVSKSSTAVNTNHVYLIIGLLVLIAVLLLYALATSGVFAYGKFH